MNALLTMLLASTAPDAALLEMLRAMSRLALKGVAGALFFKERFRVVTTFSDYEPL